MKRNRELEQLLRNQTLPYNWQGRAPAWHRIVDEYQFFLDNDIENRFENCSEHLEALEYAKQQFFATLTKSQAKQLLHKYLTGDFTADANRNKTFEIFFVKGFMTEEFEHDKPVRIIVTDKGKAYCDLFRQQI